MNKNNHQNIGRHLVTTADERTWDLDRPQLYLGEWCLRFDRKSVWEKGDYVVADPFGLGPKNKIADVSYVASVVDKLHENLTISLNSIHNTAHSPRYWKILVGHWLARFVTVAFNRYYTLDVAIQKYKISSTTVLKSKKFSLATSNSIDFSFACSDAEWNHILYSHILASIGHIDLNYSKEEAHYKNSQIPFPPLPRTIKEKIKNAMRSFASRVLNVFVRANDAFIVDSYLPSRVNIGLNFLLHQCPQLWPRVNVRKAEINEVIRSAFSVSMDTKDPFELFICKILPEVMPTCYVEGYGALQETVDRLPWPKTPKFVFTSNRYDSDEVFKAWAGEKADQGTPYCIGQHGNNWGVAISYESPPEFSTADKYLTWGWENGQPNIKSAFIFKTLGDSGRWRRNGGLFLIVPPVSPRIDTEDSYYLSCKSQEEQFKFVAGLPEHIYRELTVRIHPAAKLFQWCDVLRWQERHPAVHLNIGEPNLTKSISKSRLVVHAYDSTGILETLSLNIPTICFWENGLDHLLPFAKPYYQILQSVGIIAESPEQAVNTISQNWDSIEAWWNSPNLQNARLLFCKQFAKTTNAPAKTLINIFLSEE